MVNDRAKLKCSDKTPFSLSFVHNKSHRSAVSLKPGFRGEKPATNRTPLGTAPVHTSVERSKTGSLVLTLDKALLW
jgi:hypothetical protein